MKIVRNAVLTTNKKPMISMIVIAVFMLVFSILDFTIIIQEDKSALLRIGVMGTWTSILSIIPLSWGICTILLLKTRKVIFSKLPGYTICAMIAIAYILYYIIAGQDNTVTNILLLSVAVLLIYPIIIATLTIEGRLYNRVFATIFSVILIVLCLIGAIALFLVVKQFSLYYLVPALMYVELTLAVFCYHLEKPIKQDKTANTITH